MNAQTFPSVNIVRYKQAVDGYTLDGHVLRPLLLSGKNYVV